jgi:hypothetical protein
MENIINPPIPNESSTPLGTLPHLHKCLGLSYDPGGATAVTQLTGSTMYMSKIAVPKTITVGNLVLHVTTIGSGLTALKNWAALYNASGERLALSADQSTNWSTGVAGVRKSAFTTPVTIKGGPLEYVYASIITTGTTRPTVSTHGALGPSFGLVAADGYRFGYYAATETMPTSVVIANMNPNSVVPHPIMGLAA